VSLLEVLLGETSKDPQKQTQNYPTKHRINHKTINYPDFISPQLKRVNISKKPIRLEKESHYESETVESSLLPGACVYLHHLAKVLLQALPLCHWAYGSRVSPHC